ncbi:NAD-dependent epimerase/dehydratase family protein [Erwinia sp. S63]|uniref:NAD-dependent epimerase/dehydratase family protein n=1 Tax=Erwinia sp. S63 TaxID=2769341 RepID=UPI00190B9F28|nr:NAD-dependent epimerase/dehydratase family protein [Erwinia sp. S63]MBK0094588.1 NAD-dependent epimerase/dehydratase family protein [Erwinia sp. S63]
MRFVVTGGRGFIGQCVVKHLSDSGADVIAPTSNEWRLGQPLPKECDHADIIIHLACSILNASKNRDAMADLDHCGTSLLLQQHRALKKEGKRGRFIFISSQSAGPAAINDYGRSKWAIEALLNEEGEVIVRPGLVYSVNGGSVYGILEKLSRLPVVPTPSVPPNIQPIEVGDLAEALYRIAQLPTPKRLYLLGQIDPLTFKQMVCAIAIRSERRKPLCLPIPASFVRLAGKSVDILLQPSSSLLERVDGLLALRAMDTRDSLDGLQLVLKEFTRIVK